MPIQDLLETNALLRQRRLLLISTEQGVLAADVVSPKAVRNFECFGDGLHLFWEGNPKALYEFKNGDKQFVDTYNSASALYNEV